MSLYRHGPEALAEGGVRFRLWAPGLDAVELQIEGEPPEPMRRGDGGWFELDAAGAQAGTLYRFRLPDGLLVPDPASRFQPQDVHGPSEVIASTTSAQEAWAGRPWREAVLCELHLGAFTPEGTFRAAIDRLEHLQQLGVTAIEIMPIADFPGARNWGYDGVLPYAPDSAYGRPEDFRALVEAAHARGLMVLLDVVYNHFGPDGNYLPLYAPAFFTDRHKTPWGAAINYDGADARPVRDFVIENALYWLREFGLDGLRLDAVHAIVDDSPTPLLQEIAERVRAEDLGRPIHLLLENEENEARWLTPKLHTAQWNDDVHHVLHVAATGEDMGYYVDYLGDTEKLGRALAEGFAFQGEVMGYRGHARGEPSADLPPEAFVAFIQNHDQIGNRAFGERLTALASPEALKAISAVYLLSPQIPMLFMGEEWGATQPFPFFCDFEGELAEAVRRGRREEFKRFPQFQDPTMRARIPDPQAEATFRSAKLNWQDLEAEGHSEALERYRWILKVRAAEIVPRLDRITHGGSYEVLARSAVAVEWAIAETPPRSASPTAPPQAAEHLRPQILHREAGEVAEGRRGRATLKLLANLSDRPLPAPPLTGREIWREGQIGEMLGSWSVRWSIEEPA